MEIIHKNSGEQHSIFPKYIKYDGIYGYIAVTPGSIVEHRVVFFYVNYDDNYPDQCVGYKDLTDKFDIKP